MPRFAVRALAVLAIAAVLAACAPGGAEARLTLRGDVTAGPTCPVESASPDPACDDRPVAGAVLVVRDANGDEVTRVTSDADGAFRVDLPPGRYTVVPQPVDGLLGTGPPEEVELRAGEPPPPLAIGYDTGIR